MKRNIIIINGPNLNLLGRREVELYGNVSFEDYLEQLRERHSDINIYYFQSNHEGDLIDKIQQVGYTIDGIIINAGAYTHTSIALRDAISAVSAPAVEVHITDIYQREAFRQISYLKDVCSESIVGKGLAGYEMAIEYLTKEK